MCQYYFSNLVLSHIIPTEDTTMLPSLFKSPFNGDFDHSKSAILPPLELNRIEDQPVASAIVIYPLETTEPIKAGLGKYYGLAFLYYCLQKYGTPAEKESGLFKVTFLMAIEAQLYYGIKLWNDDTQPHPSISPFRVATQDAHDIIVQLKYEPDH